MALSHVQPLKDFSGGPMTVRAPNLPKSGWIELRPHTTKELNYSTTGTPTTCLYSGTLSLISSASASIETTDAAAVPTRIWLVQVLDQDSILTVPLKKDTSRDASR